MSETISTEMPSPNIRTFPPERVYVNPWQPRTSDDAAHISALAEDIRINGLLQYPVGRIHPQDVEAVQLAFGHSRFAAWQLAKPGEPFPIDIRELSDRQMSDVAAAENAEDKRKNLSTIETAHAIQRRMADFDLNQFEAGAPFGYKSQSAVANLLRMLKLPEAIHPLIGEAGLPERHARGLINLARALPDQAQKIAEEVAKAESKDQIFEDELAHTLREYGQPMWDMPFEKEAILPVDRVETAKKFLGNIATLPVCKGCDFFISNERTEYCMRPGCYDLKCQAATWQEVERLGKKLKIAVIQEGEKTQLIFDGSKSNQEQLAAKALAAKHESLRLAPYTKNDYNAYVRKRVLGAEHVELHTTDLTALKKAIAKLPKEKKKVAAESVKSDAAKNEKRLRERRDECRRLLRAAAPHVAKAFNYSDAVLDTMIAAMANHHFSYNSTQVGKRAKNADAAGKAQIVGEIMLAMATRAGSMYSDVTPAAAAKKIAAFAAALKVKLPAKGGQLT